MNVLKEVVEDYTEQLTYSTDPDARVGHKTADSSFFGYKTHIAINDERLITAAIVTTGEKSDGKYLQELIEKSQETGMEIETVIRDTAYSEKDNILYAKENELQLVSKLHPQITQGSRVKEDDLNSIRMPGCMSVKLGIWRFAKRGQARKIKERTKWILTILTFKNVRYVHSARAVIKRVPRVKRIPSP